MYGSQCIIKFTCKYAQRERERGLERDALGVEEVAREPLLGRSLGRGGGLRHLAREVVVAVVVVAVAVVAAVVAVVQFRCSECRLGRAHRYEQQENTQSTT